MHDEAPHGPVRPGLRRLAAVRPADPCGFHRFIAPPRARMIAAEQVFDEMHERGSEMTRITGETRSARPWIGGLAALGLALCAQVGTVGTATTASAATAPVCGPSGGAADFNKDFYTDLAIGARGDDGGKGAVTIMAGQGGGLSESN